MKQAFTLIGGLLLAGAAASTAIAQDEIDPALAAAIDARQSHMRLNAFNLSLLGAMAKGEVAYDAAAAEAAADNLAALALLDESRYWPPGTDMETLGVEHTEALAAIWAEGSEVGDRAQALVDASAEMAGAAGQGLQSLQGAMRGMGNACSGCHEEYRVADD